MSLTDIKRCWTTPKYIVLPIQESNNGKGCIIQPRRRVRQLRTVTTFARRWVADATGCCFGLFLGCHWRGIRWQRNPTLERAQQTRLTPIIREKNNLWIKRLGSIDPHRSTERICTYPAFVRVETCKCQIKQYLYMRTITHTFVRATIVSMSGRG
jgi:hypothetical protein